LIGVLGLIPHRSTPRLTIPRAETHRCVAEGLKAQAHQSTSVVIEQANERELVAVLRSSRSSAARVTGLTASNGRRPPHLIAASADCAS
jgi:hypothetical protein